MYVCIHIYVCVVVLVGSPVSVPRCVWTATFLQNVESMQAEGMTDEEMVAKLMENMSKLEHDPNFRGRSYLRSVCVVGRRMCAFVACVCILWTEECVCDVWMEGRACVL